VVRVLVLLTLFRILYFKNTRLLEEDGFRDAVGSCTRCARRKRLDCPYHEKVEDIFPNRLLSVLIYTGHVSAVLTFLAARVDIDIKLLVVVLR